MTNQPALFSDLPVQFNTSVATPDLPLFQLAECKARAKKQEASLNILKGHISPETAYVVNDYPYGFRLRCKIRYWLEYKAGKGFRFVSQTTNPKRPGEVWNKPKASTYCRFGGCMYLDDEGHVQWTGVHEYMDAQEMQKWLDTYGEGMQEAGMPLLRKMTAAKAAYSANRKTEDDLTVGIKEAYVAFAKA